MQYITIPVTAFEQNCSIVWNEATQHCALVDPGGDVPKLIRAITERNLIPQAVWLTHGHMDHVGGARAIADHYHIPIMGPQEDDAFWLDALPIQAQRFGLPHAEALKPDQWLKHGDTLKLDHYSFEVRHTPGHTPGHVVLYSSDLQTVFVGDVLFAGSIGRTDFPRGNHQQLLDSIRSQLFVLNDEIEVVPGHGPNTTIGHERAYNPYF
ncbi:MAG: MBL fold metallo-hydrolase [Thiofilum sp.]|uniref:MBL fold metallo-hydrolase n=1 Tax=Thiofilum sp. TaxID=2212733 RepID=UPI0025EC0C4F|nr:MBL fold metallo-hydrolase [Thiofilum sp.]MBK8452665.1 MBL fold metallo-hydrolase [Thiofilum sp.]